MKSRNSEIDSFLNFLESNNYEGYSVYDAFNSPFLKIFERLNSKLLNVLITQIFKRTPFNIRKIFGVKKSVNPKSLGLILKGMVLLNKPKYKLYETHDLIISFSNKNFKNLCWGYNWDYYTLRGGTFPKDFPNAIVTYFIGDAFIELYKKHPTDQLKSELISIRAYFLDDINITERNFGICFSYSSIDNKEIYNASALISKFLYETNKLFSIDDSKLLGKSISYLKHVQNKDGSWYYGFENNQKWIDSFHTQYNLDFFETLDRDTIKEFDLEKLIEKGNTYYLDNFYLNNKCNYFPNKEYPINIHSVACRIIYLCKNNFLNQAEEIIDWSFNNLYNYKKNVFYFEKNRYYTNKNVYHRWNQSWMYLALSTYKSIKNREV